MTYTALTTGPITASLDQAHKTREIWAASYLLSSLMEKIVQHLTSGDDVVKADQFVMPYPHVRTLPAYDEKIKRAGVFPDRLILESEKGLFDRLQAAVKYAKGQIAVDFKKALGNDPDAETFVDRYLRTDIVELTTQGDNVMQEVTKVLANCELQNKLIAQDGEHFVRFLENIHESGTWESVFGKKEENEGYSYPSMLDIGIRKFNKKGLTWQERRALREDGKFELMKQAGTNRGEKNWDEDDMLMAGLKTNEKYKDGLKTAHKYVAIVQADGDNVGKLIVEIYKKDSGKIKDFNKAMSTFALRAVKAIMEYGGEPVYAGGDDLLFFAPVVTNDGQVFKLLETLDNIFKGELSGSPALSELVDKLEKKPSMSYGLSVTYYKYPMHEALNAGKELLFKKAKKGRKNAIAYRLQKHSGQSFDDVLHKGSGFYRTWLQMLGMEKDNLISSILYNLERQKSSLGKIVFDKERLEQFFINTYNEDIHQGEAAKAFLGQVQDLMFNAFEDVIATVREILKGNLKNEDKLDEIMNAYRQQLRSTLNMEKGFDKVIDDYIDNDISGHILLKEEKEDQYADLPASEKSKKLDKLRKAFIKNIKAESHPAQIGKTLSKTYSALRFIKFLNRKNDE